ncbi:MAG: sigma-54-dependent transcriptional regulator [Isosphaeraceae bacterium]
MFERTIQSDPAPSRGRILIVDDEEVINLTLREFLLGEQFEVATAADLHSALAQVAAFEPDIVLCDVQLPGADGITVLNRALQIRPETLFVMITAYATVENAVAAFQRGAQDYLMKPVLFEDLLAKLDRLMSLRRLLRENQALRRQLHADGNLDALVGDSPPMRAVKTLIRKVGPTRSTVLITGESGTGKELVARALHTLGPAPDEVFLAVNCAAIPHDLLENQLFGHVRGAFTGADRDHAGVFVAAGRGTVFLDEIGELSRSTQAKLLRAIENKEVLPVGATHPVVFRARLLTASNKDLAAEVAADRFRADLYYRLNVVTIHLPPLRDRREDIPDLVAHLLAKHAKHLGKRVTGVDNATIRGLMAARWTGNVRELDNALERAVILSEDSTLIPDDFPPGLIVETDSEDSGDNLRAAVRDYERHHIQRVMRACGDDKREAARRLGLGLSSLYRKLEEMDIRT